jgi:hypothetical protein
MHPQMIQDFKFQSNTASKRRLEEIQTRFERLSRDRVSVGSSRHAANNPSSNPQTDIIPNASGRETWMQDDPSTKKSLTCYWK